MASKAAWIFITVFVLLPFIIAAAVVTWAPEAVALGAIIALFTWTALGLVLGAGTIMEA